jgi:hypothetical protein
VQFRAVEPQAARSTTRGALTRYASWAWLPRPSGTNEYLCPKGPEIDLNGDYRRGRTYHSTTKKSCSGAQTSSAVVSLLLNLQAGGRRFDPGWPH